ncbi:unnamed protein product [Microthlaspi erraticum]|uniref:Zinc knuckle CX2CX4HX4C domain-containing protein n=1 Tax=Microthlaspi erraticum TaxID=1685480 RepID=A0A6D2K749_9BRAS|nr:unnamed protein product [Microthlaspi erraticum]
MGLLMDVDYNAEAIACVEYARVRLNMDITQPLRFQKHFQFTQGINTLLRFRYERLWGFCEVCGIITHDSGACLIQNGGPEPHSEDDEDDDNDDGEDQANLDPANGAINGGNHQRNGRMENKDDQEPPAGVRIEEVVEEGELIADAAVSDEEPDPTPERYLYVPDEIAECEVKEAELRNAVTPTQESLKRKFEDSSSAEEGYQRLERGQSSGGNKKKAMDVGQVCGVVGPQPPQPP